MTDSPPPEDHSGRRVLTAVAVFVGVAVVYHLVVTWGHKGHAMGPLVALIGFWCIAPLFLVGYIVHVLMGTRGGDGPPAPIKPSKVVLALAIGGPILAIVVVLWLT